MRALIAYGTKYGSTREIAERIGERMKAKGLDVRSVDVKDASGTNIADYDVVVVGSAIMMGKWTKPAERFITSNEQALSAKKVAFFACCGDAANPDLVANAQKRYLDEVVARHPAVKPISTGLFAGVIDFNKYGFLVKSIMKSEVKKRGTGSVDQMVNDFRDWKAVDAWADSLV